MPYRRKTNYRRKAPIRRRRYRKRTRGVVPYKSTAVQRKTLFPPRFFTRLTYTDNHSIVSTIPAWKQYTINSLYDPETAAGGGQPYGFDQIAALYEDYRVHGCKIEVKGSVRTTGAPCVIMRGYHATTAQPASIEEADEQRQYKVNVITDQKPFYFKQYVSMARITGKSKTAMNGDLAYSAGVGAGPSNKLYYNVGTSHMDSASTVQVDFIVKLTFYTEFNNLKDIARS